MGSSCSRIRVCSAEIVGEQKAKCQDLSNSAIPATEVSWRRCLVARTRPTVTLKFEILNSQKFEIWLTARRLRRKWHHGTPIYNFVCERLHRSLPLLQKARGTRHGAMS